MKVLVTGGAGFIGSHIVDALIERGHDVLVMDDYSSGRRENLPPKTHVWMPGSITWRSEEFHGQPTHTAIGLACESFQPDAICHQAAQPSLRCSIDDPAYDAMVNIVGTLNVIQAAKACGAHVVFASTSAVYADVGHPLKETGPFQPTTPYGLAKYAAEHYIELLAPSYTILRYGNVYGPRQVQVGENQLIPHCLAHLLDGEPFVINGDGEQTRDFVYVGDIARANVLAIEGRVQGVFNCGMGQGRQINHLCEFLAACCQQEARFEHGPAKAGEARHVALDPTYARKALGWEAETGPEIGLLETVAWWKEHRCVSV
jgi:UDP-glucose 4-epimerase